MANVPVLAPAPVRHVPARSRDARTSYAPVVEDVTIRELSLADAAEGPRLPVNGGRTVATRIIDGRLWRSIGADDPFGAASTPANRVIARDEFVGWLAGREDLRWMDEADFGRCIEGTPLLARVPGQRAPQRPAPTWNTDRQGRILLDGREAAPGRIRRFVDERVALVADVPFMRMEGPFAYFNAGAGVRDDRPATMTLMRHPGGWTTNPAINMANHYRHDRLHDPHTTQIISPARIKPSWNPRDLDGLTGPEGSDDDLLHNLAHAIRVIAANAPRQGYPFAADRRARMDDLVALNSVGAIGDDDLPAAWAEVKEFCSSIETGHFGWVVGEARRIRSYCLTLVDGRLERRAARLDHAGDVDALAGLAPA